MNEKTSLCPNCGTPLPGDAPKGLCPECLLRGGFESVGVAEAPSSTDDFREHMVHPGGPGDEPLAQETVRYFGDYELLEQIAVGGMGVVFKARQLSLNRLVAVKMIRAGQLARESDIRRFRTEAEAAASLTHPHIVAIHEVGEHQGRHFFSMDFIEGRSLAELVRDHPLEPARAARLIQTVAEAIAYAHGRGVLHRDLKPSNVMIDARDQPHVTDFGLAKMLGSDSELTHLGAVMGSPSYMSPEQARGRGDQVSVRSDVYALGAILYELLTARPPFLAATALETMKLVAERDPVAPRVLNPTAPRDLETICLKCLQKEPAHRYASAEALAEDLACWRRHEPIHARPSGAFERGRKWARRKPAQAALAVVCLFAAIVVVALVLIHGRQLTRERNLAQSERNNALSEARRADEARAETRLNLYAADLLLAQHALEEGNLSSARSHLLAWQPGRMSNDGFRMTNGPASPSPRGSRGNEAQTAGDQSLLTSAATSADPRGFEWRYLWQQCQGDEEHTFRGHSNTVRCVAFSRDGTLLASSDETGRVIFWDMRERKASGSPLVTGSRLVRISFSADDQALATADERGRTKVWNLATRKVVWSHRGRNVEGVQLSPTGTLIGVSRERLDPETGSAAQVIDWTTGKEVLSVPRAGFEAFSPDGKLAFIGLGLPPRLELWELATGRLVQTMTNFGGTIFPSPDGRYLAAIPVLGASEFPVVDLRDDRPPDWFRLNRSRVRRAAFSPDGSRLAAVGGDQSVHLWDVAAQREIAPLKGHTEAVTDVAYSPDGQWLATASADQTVKLWSATRQQRHGDVFQSEGKPAAWFRASPDGRTLAAFHSQAGLWLFDLATREFAVLSRAASLHPEFFSADSRTLFARGAVDSNGFLPLLRWNLNAPTQPPETALLQLARTNAINSAAVTTDRSVYALSEGQGNAISLWNPLTGESVGRLHAPPGERIGGPVCFSPDGRKLVTLGWPGTLRLIEMTAPERQWIARSPVWGGPAAFSPDGKIVSAACGDHSIRLFDTDTLKEVAVLPGHQSVVARMAWSPDGRTLASVDGGDVVKLWCVAARREVTTVVQGNCGSINALGFTPDGDTLWAGSWTGQIHLWRVPDLAEIDQAR